ncbi:hypothetical protein FPQ18DRAFT_306859 [Pyronema domesticum]|nr:hypothetical protein FPQ18DRAFT_306859 [Pyronema domesticum]
MWFQKSGRWTWTLSQPDSFSFLSSLSNIVIADSEPLLIPVITLRETSTEHNLQLQFTPSMPNNDSYDFRTVRRPSAPAHELGGLGGPVHVATTSKSDESQPNLCANGREARHC